MILKYSSIIDSLSYIQLYQQNVFHFYANIGFFNYLRCNIYLQSGVFKISMGTGRYPGTHGYRGTVCADPRLQYHKSFIQTNDRHYMQL